MTTVQLEAPALIADKIDDVNGVIHGVSVITSGLIARGHDLEVDSITLEQMQACADSKGQVPVKVNHKSGAEAICGYLCNFHQSAGRLRADWHLLQSHPQRDQILETARRMPRGVGLSVSFVTPDGAASGKARCEDLISVDYVTLPAANPDGLFSAVLDAPPSPRVGRDLVSRVQSIMFERRSTVHVIEKAIAKNVELPIPGRDAARAIAHQAGRPAVVRVVGRIAKIAAGAGTGAYLAGRYGKRAGVVAGATIGALLFQDSAVRQNVELSVRDAKRL